MTDNLLETCKKCGGEGFKREAFSTGYYFYACGRCLGAREVKWTENILKRDCDSPLVEVFYKSVAPVENITINLKIGENSYEYYNE